MHTFCLCLQELDRNLQRNLLTFHWCRGKSGRYHFKRRRPLERRHLLLLPPLHLFQLLMLIRRCFHPFLSLLGLEGCSRFAYYTLQCILNFEKHICWFSQFLQSSEPVELTEAETEYAVNVVKHIYDSYVVLQYNCTNTIEEQLLEDVSSYISSIFVKL